MTALIWVIVGLVALVAGIFLLTRKGKAHEPAAQTIRTREFDHELAREITPDPGPTTWTPTPHHVLELPRSYGQDRLVLMARDPFWLYAYWEIAAAKESFQASRGRRAWQVSRPVLRVYDVTGVEAFNGGNANSYVDIPLSADADNWHIEVGNPDRTYCVDLGRLMPNGEFVFLLRSNIVTTPRATLSDRLDEEWMWIEDIYRSITRIHFGVSSPLVIEEMKERLGVAPFGISSPEMVVGRGRDN